jgi:hypothetical protein
MFVHRMRKFLPLLAQKWYFLTRNSKNIQNLQTSHCYIFPILQHFATKLCNFTNFKMLFLAVVVGIVPLA